MSTTKKHPPRPATTLPSTETNGTAYDVLTLAEASAYLRVNETDLIDLVRSQSLPGRYIGREWRFLKSAIQEWLSAAAPNLQMQKAAQLALAGKYKDDPDLMGICEEAYRKRNSPTTEGE